MQGLAYLAEYLAEYLADPDASSSVIDASLDQHGSLGRDRSEPPLTGGKDPRSSPQRVSGGLPFAAASVGDRQGCRDRSI